MVSFVRIYVSPRDPYIASTDAMINSLCFTYTCKATELTHFRDNSSPIIMSARSINSNRLDCYSSYKIYYISLV